MTQTATAPRPIIRPFIALDRVDKAREVFRLARKGLTASQIAARHDVDPSTILSIARDEAIAITLGKGRKHWPSKHDKGITSENWTPRVKRGRRGRPSAVAPDLPPPPIVVRQGAPFNFISSPAARNIIVLVALRHGVSFDDILGPRRYREVMAARHEAIRLVFTHTQLATTTMERLFNRDHTTILSSLGRTNKNRAKGKMVRDRIERGAL